MILEQNVDLIVMLCKLMEMNKVGLLCLSKCSLNFRLNVNVIGQKIKGNR